MKFAHWKKFVHKASLKVTREGSERSIPSNSIICSDSNVYVLSTKNRNTTKSFPSAPLWN
jgi:hypothetical protein